MIAYHKGASYPPSGAMSTTFVADVLEVAQGSEQTWGDTVG